VDGRLFPEGIEYPVFHDNQEYTWGENIPLLVTEMEKGPAI
jgi:hypothetical protein